METQAWPWRWPKMARSPEFVSVYMPDAYWADTDESSIPPATRRVRLHWRAILRAITQQPFELHAMTNVRCMKRPKHRSCTGNIVGSRTVETDDIAWICVACGAGGLFQHWQGCLDDWSQSEVTPIPRAVGSKSKEVRLSLDDFDFLSKVAIFSLSTPVINLIKAAERQKNGGVLRGSYASLVALREFVENEAHGHMMIEEEDAGKSVRHPPKGSSAERYTRIYNIVNDVLE